MALDFWQLHDKLKMLNKIKNKWLIMTQFAIFEFLCTLKWKCNTLLLKKSDTYVKHSVLLYKMNIAKSIKCRP